MTPSFPRFSTSRIVLSRDPYLHGFVDEYLPADLYHELSEAFIDPATHPDMEVLGRGKKRLLFRAPPVPESIASVAPRWSEAAGSVASQEFRDDCWQWLHERAPIASQPEGPYRELMRARLATDPRSLVVQCEFSSMQDGVFLPPHSDSTDKVISFVLYFAPPQWQRSWGGGTEVYEPKDPERRFNWNNHFLDPSEMRTSFVCEFAPNRLFFLVKGCNAWHGVSPLAAPPGVQRRSFNFSLLIPDDVMAASSCAPHHAEILRREAEIYRRPARANARRAACPLRRLLARVFGRG